MNNFDELHEYYKEHKQEMDDFLHSYKERGMSKDATELFKWLCKNILASQAKWEKADQTVEYLNKHNILFTGDLVAIKLDLQTCQYKSPNNANKAKWICEAQQKFIGNNSEIGIVDFVDILNAKCTISPLQARNLLAARNDNHISGIGMKEASHFLRGLGFSYNKLAILDSVVIKKLVNFRIIEKCPENLSKSIYLSIEDTVRNWVHDEIHIPLDGFDWMLWKMGRKNNELN